MQSGRRGGYTRSSLADFGCCCLCACTCRSVCLVALMTLQQSMIYAFSTKCQQKSRISARTRRKELLQRPLSLSHSLSSARQKAAFKGSGMEICIECVAYFRAERWNCFQLTHTSEHACTALSRIYLEPTTQAAGSSISLPPFFSRFFPTPLQKFRLLFDFVLRSKSPIEL